MNVTRGAVSNHADEEEGVEPREGALKASDKTPRDGEPDIGRVVDLAGESVPTVDEDGALGGGDGLGVVDGLPGDLGEGLAPDNLALLHGTEAVLLTVAAIPDPVPEEVSREHGGEDAAVPTVDVRVVVGKVDGAVAVRKGNASKVPEDEHETPLLIVHVPGPG